MTGTASEGPGTGRPRAARALPLLAVLGLLHGGWACGEVGPARPGEPGVPTDLAVVAGDGERAPAGTAVPEGPAVTVRDGTGEPVAGVEVAFAVVRGGGRVDPSTATTDESGRARTVWVLGSDPGRVQAVEASAGTLEARIETTAEVAEAGARYEGRNGHTVWRVGDLPLILSAPHGGDREPPRIPDRTRGVMVKDVKTLELAVAVLEVVRQRTGGRPHLVYSRLHRTKLDPNREIQEASQGRPAAERAWHEYHAFLEAAKARAKETHGSGLLLDVHGHSHDVPRVELGYLLDHADLARSDFVLASGFYADRSSIRDLAARSPAPFPELLRGEISLGGLLADRAVPVVPGPSTTNPGDEPYFSGGYITARHGAAGGGTVSAIQLEHHGSVRRTPGTRLGYAETLTEALREYFPTHFGKPLQAGPGSGAPALLSRSTAPGPLPGAAASTGSPPPSAPRRR